MQEILDLELKYFDHIYLVEDPKVYIIDFKRSWIFFEVEVASEVEIPSQKAKEYISAMVQSLENLLEWPYTTNGFFLVEYSELHRKVPIPSHKGEMALEDLKVFLSFLGG